MEVVGLMVLHGFMEQGWEDSEDSAGFCSWDDVVYKVGLSSELVKVTEYQQFGLKLNKGLVLEHAGGDKQ